MESTNIFDKINTWAYSSKIYPIFVALAIIIDVYIIGRGQLGLGLILLSMQIPWIMCKIKRMIREKNENS